MTPEVQRHFKRVDPILSKAAAAIDRLEPITPRQPDEFFVALCRDIIYQQLAGAAARAISERFYALFPENTPSPRLLNATSYEELRAIGLSGAKARYIKDLAMKVETGEVQLGHLGELSDEEVIAELVKIHGIGRWTAEMFLMFSLGREDVFSFGDLGLRRAMEQLYGVKDITRDRAEVITLPWQPYRTWASRILWATVDT